ncbi:MAG: metal-dependent hydrolase, partial [Calditrichaeota bacterium]
MDTLTQITLGAAVGEAVLGRQVGNRAPLWGAVCGLVPDLDVLAAPFLDPASRLLFHRGPSHSITFALLLSGLLGPWLARRYGNTGIPTRQWLWLVFLATVTHPLLDCFTAYGTSLLWPFSSLRISWNTIFVVDPLYTVPLLLCTLALLFYPRTSAHRRRLNWLGLGLSTVYLAATVGAKIHAQQTFSQALAKQSIPVQRLFVGPTPFNSVLWRGVAEGDSAYWEGFYSLLDKRPPQSFRRIEKNHHLLAPLVHLRPVKRLVAFTRGYFAVRKIPGGLYLYDLRYGETDGWLDLTNQPVFGFRLFPQYEGRRLRVQIVRV